MELDKAIYFADSSEWRQWLEKNHSTANNIWLIFYKRNSGTASISYDEAVEEALCFGWIDGKMRSVDEEKYVIRYSPRRAKSLWSKRNKDKAEELIHTGRMTEAGLAAIEVAKKNGNWAGAYTSRTQEEITEDLLAALEEDPVALENFLRFANSYRNNYIGWINDAKTEPTRKRRISEVVRRSRLNQKPGMM